MAHSPLEFLYERFTDVRRGPAPRAARRRAHRPRHRDLPRRLDARGHRRRARSRRTCSPPARRRRCGCSATALQLHRRATRSSSSCSATSAIASRTSSRRRCASRARSRATSGCPASPTTVGGVDVPAGTTVMVLNGAANRDPRQFEDPDEFRRRPRERAPAPRVRARHPHLPRRAARPRRGPRQHRAAARPHGRHQDLGAEHGPPGARRYEYAPTYILRGLQHLHLEFTPI